MRSARWLLLLLGAWHGAALAAVPVDEIALEMKARDADVLFKKYAYDTSSFPVTLVDGDQRLTGRIEVKGATARVFSKKPVLIKLDPPHRWRGHSRLSLNAMATDSSLVREWLAWDLIEALGMPAPETGYVRLRINGVDKGLYFRIEWVGPNVFERYGFGRDGELYDPVDQLSCADLSPASVADPELCWVKIAPFDGDFTSLRRLVAAIDAAPVETIDAFLEREFDAESVVNWIAVTAVVLNLTTYNNEYWPYYSRARGRWVIMPWDYDRSFGKNFDHDLAYPRNKINDNFQYYYPLEVGASNALRDKLFKNPRTRERIRQRVLEIIDGTPDAAHRWRGWFDPERMAQRMAMLREAVAPEAARDPLLAGDPARFRQDLESVLHFARARAAYLRRTLAPEPLGEPDVGRASLAPAGRATHVIDGLGLMLARLTPVRPARGDVTVTVRRGWPELVPSGSDRAGCIQRSWLVAGPGGLEADLTVEYLQEVSRSSEVGTAVDDEARLWLYAAGEGGWWQYPTRTNVLANTLTARVRLPARGPLRLVACNAPIAPLLAAH